jgi:hypothetical protein
LAVLEVPTREGIERLHPQEVLEFQEQHADVAFTLDFPIPPRPIQPRPGAAKIWPSPMPSGRSIIAGLPLFACIQAWDEKIAGQCAAALAAPPF